MIIDNKIVNGERVRHSTRPEWGIGTVTKVESVPVNGHTTQRVFVRFPNAGLKTILSEHAVLERVNESSDPFSEHHDAPVVAWDKLEESDWLSPVVCKKIDEAMTRLPENVRDPFSSIERRLSLTLGLYRFGRNGKGLVDWAVAQTGLDDPLSRFTRHDLEVRFDRWTRERDSHLARLLDEVGKNAELLEKALVQAPPEARDCVRRLNATR